MFFILTLRLIRRYRKSIRSCWRKLNPGQQALLVLVYLRKGETFAELAAAIAAAARRAEESALAVRTRQRYEQVQALKARGKGVKPIMRETGLAKETVRRFYRAATVDELLAKVRDGRPSILDEHKPYLHQRWNEGITNVIQLHSELKERGYKGGYGTIRDYVLPFREAGAAPPAVPGPPKARDLASWILTDPDNLGDQEKAKLAQARERCPHLDALAGHVTDFAKILTGLNGGQLDEWITAVEADDQPDLHSFVRGIKHDYDAVLHGLTMAWNSGVVEGNVNRLKMLKRQMLETWPRRGRDRHEIRVRSRRWAQAHLHTISTPSAHGLHPAAA